MKRKFKMRVVHYAEHFYKIQYAHYWVIPIWHTLNQWSEFRHPNMILGWSTELISGASAAEEYAKTFKSIEDIRAFYAKENEKERQWRIEEKEWWQKNVPYQNKTIKTC